MKKYLLLLVVLFPSICFAQAYHSKTKGCEYTLNQGTRSITFSLWGNVKVVEGNAYSDLDVRIAKEGEAADLEVVITDKPNACGQWRIVDKGEDFTIKFVDKYEDITIRFVQKRDLPEALPY